MPKFVCECVLSAAAALRENKGAHKLAAGEERRQEAQKIFYSL